MTEYDALLLDVIRARGRLGPDETAAILAPPAHALMADHAAGRAHGRISPAAIGVDDVGRGVLLPTNEVAVDDDHRAPELSADAEPTRAGDVWSLGSVAFHLIAGHPPFAHSTEPPARLRAAGWLGPLVEMMLSPDPGKRPTMAEVDDFLRARPEPTTAVLPVASEPVADAAETARPGRHGRDRPARSGRDLAVVGGVAVVVLAVIGVLLLVLGGGGDDDSSTAASQPRTHAAASSGPASSPASTSTSQPTSSSSSPGLPTARQLTDFARTYVATASSDPAKGFTYLTPSYQAASPRYQQFWGAVSDAKILSVTADPATMRVSYTYRYRLNGSARTESVTLELVQHGDRLLITGAA